MKKLLYITLFFLLSINASLICMNQNSEGSGTLNNSRNNYYDAQDEYVPFGGRTTQKSALARYFIGFYQSNTNITQYDKKDVDTEKQETQEE